MSGGDERLRRTRQVGGRARAALAGLALLLPGSLLGGCGLVGDGDPVFSVEWVALISEPGSNRNNPTAVDLVLIYDPGLTDTVSTLTAGDWFRRKTQFRRDFPNGFKVLGWEVVPSQAIAARELEDDDIENAEGDAPTAAFVFADYYTPGDHRARLETRTAIRIRLGQDDFTLESFDPPN